MNQSIRCSWEERSMFREQQRKCMGESWAESLMQVHRRGLGRAGPDYIPGWFRYFKVWFGFESRVIALKTIWRHPNRMEYTNPISLLHEFNMASVRIPSELHTGTRVFVVLLTYLLHLQVSNPCWYRNWTWTWPECSLSVWVEINSHDCSIWF